MRYLTSYLVKRLRSDTEAQKPPRGEYTPLNSPKVYATIEEMKQAKKTQNKPKVILVVIEK